MTFLKKLIKVGLGEIWDCRYWIGSFSAIFFCAFFFGVKEHSVTFFIKEGGAANFSTDSLRVFKELPFLEPVPIEPITVSILNSFSYILSNLQACLIILLGGLFTIFLIPIYKLLELGFLYGGICFELTKFKWYGILAILPHGILEFFVFLTFCSLPLNFCFGLWMNRKKINFKKSIWYGFKSICCSVCLLSLILIIAGFVEGIVSLRLYNLLARPLWEKGIVTEKIEIESNNLIKVFYETTDEIKCKDTAQKLSYFGKGIIPLLKNEILKGSSTNSKLWCSVTLRVIDSEKAKNIILQAIEKNNITEEDKKLLQQIIK